MRTFIAIEIPDAVRQQLAELQRGLNSGVEASWPKPEGIHLTLKFLGEVPESRIPEIIAALQSAGAGKTGFSLGIETVGTFPNPRNARVVWAGVSGELEKLKQFQAAVEEAMVGLGIEREDRAFKPHFTLGRIKYIRSRSSWLDALDRVKDLTLPGFEVKTVSLMKSELKRTGAEYTQIAKVDLK